MNYLEERVEQAFQRVQDKRIELGYSDEVLRNSKEYHQLLEEWYTARRELAKFKAELMTEIPQDNLLFEDAKHMIPEWVFKEEFILLLDRNMLDYYVYLPKTKYDNLIHIGSDEM